MHWIDQLRPEQRLVLERDTSRGMLVLGDVGTGKTFISLALIEHTQAKRVLIVAPLTSIPITWLPRLRTLEATGLRTVRCIDDIRAKNASRAPRALDSMILIVHYQYAATHRKRLARIPWDMAIIDEAQGLRARASSWSRMARALRHVPHRIALTATPLDQTPIELWGIMRFVAPQVLGDTFGPFAYEFCYRGGYMGHKWIFNNARLPRLLERIEPYIFRLTKDKLNLPPLTVHMVGTRLLGEERRYYERMERTGIVDGVIAPRTVTRQGKLEQLTGGGMLNEDGIVLRTGRAKLRKLSVLVPSLPTPLVVFCKYLHEIEPIKEVMSGNVAVLHGKVKDKPKDPARTNLINDFQAGKIDALICQMRTGGVSIELTRSSTLVFYSMNFSLIDFEQVIGRFHRGGQDKPVNVYILFAQNTVDDQIIDAIETKHSDFYKVVSHFKEGRNGKEGKGSSSG